MTLVTSQHFRVQLKRAYAPPSPEDGARVLVDRLWPRGLRKSAAAIDRWVKDVAPSTELRRWFGHDPSRWVEFRRRYKAELAHKTESSASFGRSRETIRSRSSLRLATSCITRPSFSGTFLQVELVRCRLSPWSAKCTTFSHTHYLDAERSSFAKCSTAFHPTLAPLYSACRCGVSYTEGLVASKRARRTKRRTWSKVDVRELKAHSRSKSPVKKIAKAMKRTVGALRQKALSLGLPLGHRR